MIRIYVVEDDRNIQEIETFALQNVGYQVKGFDCAKDFKRGMAEDIPDLVILDIMLPDADGVELLKELRRNVKTEYLPVILVTAKSLEIDKVKGLDSGADDYLTKPFGVMELISRVKALLRRAKKIKEDEILVLSEITMDLAKHSCMIQDETVELTYKEFELLRLLIENAGIVMKRNILMENVWGMDYAGESRTLDVHIKTLRQKLGEAGKHIKTIRNVGYKAE